MSQRMIPIEPGVQLRRWRADDRAALLRHADDPEVARYTSHRFPNPYTEADAVKFLRAQQRRRKGELGFAIEVDGEACGGIAAHAGEGVDAHVAELGYWIGRAHWGRGLMSRVVAAFWPLAMRELQLYRLFARVVKDNAASARLLERNGFEREGCMRNAVFKHGRCADSLLFARVRDRLDD